MYFFSNTYIQINNNTKANIKVRIGKTPRAFGLLPLLAFHLETKSEVLSSLSTLESV